MCKKWVCKTAIPMPGRGTFKGAPRARQQQQPAICLLRGDTCSKFATLLPSRSALRSELQARLPLALSKGPEVRSSPATHFCCTMTCVTGLTSVCKVKGELNNASQLSARKL